MKKYYGINVKGNSYGRDTVGQGDFDYTVTFGTKEERDKYHDELCEKNRDDNPIYRTIRKVMTTKNNPVEA